MAPPHVLVSTAAVGQQFVDRGRGVFYDKMVEMFKKVTGAAHAHVCRHRLRAVKDNADGNGFNTSVQPYAIRDHSDSSRYVVEKAFLRFAGNAVDAKFCKKALRVHQRVAKHHHEPHRAQLLGSVQSDRSGVI